MHGLDDHHGAPGDGGGDALRRAGAGRGRRRGFTLVEAVAATAVLALATPTLFLTLTDSARAAVAAERSTRAVLLAETVLAHVLADAGSADPALGFDTLADPAAYQSALRARTDPIFGDFYTGLGLTWTLTIEPVTTSQVAGVWTAVVNPGKPERQYRRVTATVQWLDPDGQARTLDLAVLVAELS